MMDDIYIYVITALLPLSACMVVVQQNPYHALVIRGILGAVAALVYAVLGAADVALTEALVGTMLAITLYAVAVRSSLNLRLGVLQEDLARLEGEEGKNRRVPDALAPLHNQAQALVSLMAHLRPLVKRRHMRLELIPYPDIQALEAGLKNRDLHAICLPPEVAPTPANIPGTSEFDDVLSYGITTRIRRLYDLMQTELPILAVSLTYVNSAESPLPTIPLSTPALPTSKELPS